MTTTYQNKTQSPSNIYLDIEIVQPYFEQILTYLGVDYKNNGRRLTGTCPVHDGDNPNAWSMWLEGHTTSGNWKCFTHGCHKEDNSFIGLLRHILSAKHKQKFNNQQVIKWLLKLLKIDINSLSKNSTESIKLQLDKQVHLFANGDTDITVVPRQSVISRLKIPSSYYLNLSNPYLAETLTEFDIGDCTTQGKKFFERAIVPIYDITGENYLGCSARAIAKKCEACGGWHRAAPKCPSYFVPKWLDDYPKETTLYNIWKAKPFIEESNSVIIVESPGNVWRLWETGRRNVVATLGSYISEKQLDQLSQCMTLDIYVCGDNDSGGELLVKDVQTKSKRRFHCTPFKVSGDDIGEMTVSQLNKELGELNL